MANYFAYKHVGAFINITCTYDMECYRGKSSYGREALMVGNRSQRTRCLSYGIV